MRSPCLRAASAAARLPAAFWATFAESLAIGTGDDAFESDERLLLESAREVAYHCGQRITTSWPWERFVTPLDIAVRMAGPFLVEQGIDPSEDGLGPALIMRLLMGLPQEHTYFRPLAEQPSMAQALWATIREMRMAGIHAKDIESKVVAFESAEKHSELTALVHAYEQYLGAFGVGPGVVHRAPLTLSSQLSISALSCPKLAP